MPDHVRKQIRVAAVAALMGLPTTGAHVYPSRLHALQDSELPALLVSNPGEEVVAITIVDDPTLERTMNLEVRAVLKQTNGYEDAVDQVAAEVEAALAANPTLGGLCRLQLTRISTELSGEGEKPVAVATLDFSARYYTASTGPGTAL